MSKLLAAVGLALIAFAGVLACGVLLAPVGVGQAAPVETLAPVAVSRGGMDGWQAAFFVALLLIIFGLFLLAYFKQMDHVATMRQASHPPAPHILHMHPTEPARVPAEKDTSLLPGPEPGVQLVARPAVTFASQIDAIRARGEYLAAHRVLDGAPIWLSADAGRSLLAAGQGGAGKTTHIVQAACQELLIPASRRGIDGLSADVRYILLDPAARKPQSLSTRLAGALDNHLLLRASSAADILRAARAFNAELRGRLDSGLRDGHRFLLALVADDVSLIYDDPDYEEAADELTLAFKRANTQYRSVGGVAIAGVQLLQAYAFGGGKAAMKRSFYTRAYGRLDTEDGALAGMSPALSRTLPTLPAGEFYVSAPGVGLTRGSTPTLAPDDPARVVAASQDPAPGRRFFVVPGSDVVDKAVSPVSGGFAPVSPLETDTGGDTAPLPHPKRAAVLEALAAKQKQTPLIETIWGAKSGAGPGWTTANEEYREILADLARRALMAD